MLLVFLNIRFVLRILKFLSYFGQVGKWLDNKTEVNFKIYDVINWEANYHNTPIPQYLNIPRSKGNKTKKFRQSTEYKERNIFFQRSCRKNRRDRETGSKPLFFKKVLYSK